VQECQVCDNPRRPGLSTSQIEWHNLGHPGLVDIGRQVHPGKLRTFVVIRPGDQIMYESGAGKWSRIDELDIAIAAGRSVNSKVTDCRRCSRRVLERRRPVSLGFWRSLIESVALKSFGKAG
jgi:hypothetical protein